MSKVFTIAEGLENLGALRTGGQGSVYKGKRIGTIYSAIKLIPTPIHTEDNSDKNYVNFINEVTKLQKVNENPSPNVVKILSWGITDSGSFPYIEMEFIEGPELSGLLEPPHPKAFSVKELVRVADQLAGAIAHCHRVGVKHGDIKSNNVKYNIHTGNFVLLDFGLAIMSEEQRRTSIRHAGAIEFMAPEQHEGKMLLQSDIYSFGIILYELLAGQVPFPLTDNGDTSRNRVMVNHLEGKIPDPMQLRKQNLVSSLSGKEDVWREMQVPSWLLAVLDKCLKKDPSERYANGMELLEAITSGMLITSHENPLPGNIPAPLPIANKTGTVQITRGTLTAWVAIICLLVALLTYAALDKNERVVYYATTPDVKPFAAPYVTPSDEYLKQLKRAEEIRIWTQQQKVLNAQRAAAAAEKSKTEEVQKKKKRKKFLGIF
ncbi:serine/threonine protein kinase [Pedobacter insulae]|uniref:Protein kinase domain-containing protein n=1 Tax=Pedobacter insulae TaxID=414048 RepID=A0A1I2WYS4_9SPHI|nr:serine/threonine-protein kinase [Pedobacter insulae]SFH05779.1 Protein kinase domain-containing protein [Pedobacter insulae]